jgi:hypothetical protein
MTISRDVINPDGSKWEAVSDGFDIEEPCVLVPVSAIDKLDDATLAAWVRLAKPEAEYSAALMFADYVVDRGVRYLDEATLTGDTSKVTLLYAYRGHSALIDEAIRVIEKIKARIEARPEIKDARVGIAAKYDKLFLAIGRRDGFQCQHCGASKDLAIDHIQPLILGGSNELDNLQILCKSCNSRKSDK